MGAGRGREVWVANLDGDSRRRQPALLETLGNLRGHAVEDAVDLVEVLDVFFEGVFGAQALAFAVGMNRPIIDPAHALKQNPTPIAEPRHQPVNGEFSEFPQSRDSHLVQRAFGGRADSVEPTHRQRCEERLNLVWPHDRQSVGLAKIGCDLGHQLVGRNADTDSEASLLQHPAADVLGDCGCAGKVTEMIADVEEGLVQRQRLDEGCVVAIDGEDLLRLLPVAFELRAKEDRVRA